MTYPLEKAFQSVEYQGVKRVITLCKLALKEMPRLQAAFMNPIKQNTARAEILWIFKIMELEIIKAQAFENMNEEAFNQALYKKENFSLEEWEALQNLRFLVNRFSHLLFKGPTKNKHPKLFFPKA